MNVGILYNDRAARHIDSMTNLVDVAGIDRYLRIAFDVDPGGLRRGGQSRAYDFTILDHNSTQATRDREHPIGRGVGHSNDTVLQRHVRGRDINTTADIQPVD